jgi:hypothetical protein
VLADLLLVVALVVFMLLAALNQAELVVLVAVVMAETTWLELKLSHLLLEL